MMTSIPPAAAGRMAHTDAAAAHTVHASRSRFQGIFSEKIVVDGKRERRSMGPPLPLSVHHDLFRKNSLESAAGRVYCMGGGGIRVS
ncbi:MAG TPA: hypothetical protein VHG08_12650, partial [Longimicrobium sp.]|nr:hypothetical protein [Longimicrobium sp.]